MLTALGILHQSPARVAVLPQMHLLDVGAAIERLAPLEHD